MLQPVRSDFVKWGVVQAVERVKQNHPPRTEVQGLMSRVFALDRRIRYCAILGKTGTIVTGGMRPGRRSLEPGEEARKVDAQMAVIHGMTEGSTSYFGKTNYFVVHRERLMLIAVPQGDGSTVEISALPDFPLEKVRALIKVVCMNYRKYKL